MTIPNSFKNHPPSIFTDIFFTIKTRFINAPVDKDILVAIAAPIIPILGINKRSNRALIINIKAVNLKMRSALPMPANDAPIGWAILPLITVPISSNCNGRKEAEKSFLNRDVIIQLPKKQTPSPINTKIRLEYFIDLLIMLFNAV